MKLLSLSKVPKAVRFGVLVGGLSLLMLGQAGAAAGPTVSVSPRTNLIGGDTVGVRLSHYNPSEGVIVLECNGDAAIPRDGSGCDVGHASFASTNAFGNARTTLTLHKGNQVGANPLADCPPSAADYAAGVNCVIAGSSLDQSDFGATPIYFTPVLFAKAHPATSGSSKLVVNGSKFATFGLPAGCAAGTNGATNCTSVVGETVQIALNGSVIGTTTADPSQSGRIAFSGPVNLIVGPNVVTATGVVSGEQASVTIYANS